MTHFEVLGYVLSPNTIGACDWATHCSFCIYDFYSIRITEDGKGENWPVLEHGVLHRSLLVILLGKRIKVESFSIS